MRLLVAWLLFVVCLFLLFGVCRSLMCVVVCCICVAWCLLVVSSGCACCLFVCLFVGVVCWWLFHNGCGRCSFLLFVNVYWLLLLLFVVCGWL